MTAEKFGELALDIDDRVRRVPGVSTLYRSTSLLAGIAAATVTAVLPVEDSLVLIDEKDGMLGVTVSIGTAGGSAADICRAVHDTISSRLQDEGYEHAAIKVTVAYAAE